MSFDGAKSYLSAGIASANDIMLFSKRVTVCVRAMSPLAESGAGVAGAWAALAETGRTDVKRIAAICRYADLIG
jgi:hypothetical protein